MITVGSIIEVASFEGNKVAEEEFPFEDPSKMVSRFVACETEMRF